MPAFLIDEDMPRSTAPALLDAGYDVADVRDVGLSGRTDHDVFRYAQTANATIISRDLDFANILSFPLGTHHGILVVRLPNEVHPRQVNAEVLRALTELGESTYRASSSSSSPDVPVFVDWPNSQEGSLTTQ